MKKSLPAVGMDIVFLGIQGCGKGTQAKILLKDLPNYWYFEMGQTIRALMLNENMIGEYIKDVVNSGKMIDDFITHDLFHTGIKIAQTNNKSLIIDGFPRLKTQAEFFSKKMKEMNRDYVVIHLELSKEQALERMMKRASIEGRKDDTPEAMQQRIDIFMNETVNVIHHFEELGKAITIDANGSIDDIEKKIRTHLGL
ncbi:MAG: nucleoside monophosphate kinase [candidate division SR1 bacterium]|nr:nucleoside monophosphate kinase [candidate division SR1 bacterium]